MLRRPDLVLELAAPFDVDALGQLHLLGDDALGLLDEADHVAAADVERDVVEQPAVLALDHRRALDDAHVGDGAQRDQRPCRVAAWLGRGLVRLAAAGRRGGAPCSPPSAACRRCRHAARRGHAAAG